MNFVTGLLSYLQKQYESSTNVKVIQPIRGKKSTRNLKPEDDIKSQSKVDFILLSKVNETHI